MMFSAIEFLGWEGVDFIKKSQMVMQLFFIGIHKWVRASLGEQVDDKSCLMKMKSE